MLAQDKKRWYISSEKGKPKKYDEVEGNHPTDWSKNQDIVKVSCRRYACNCNALGTIVRFYVFDFIVICALMLNAEQPINILKLAAIIYRLDKKETGTC